MNYKVLSNGVKIPVLGFWVFQIPAENTKESVLSSLKAGYRHIDTAEAYFNEKEVWEAIKESWIAREEIFVTTKLWISGYSYENARLHFEKSLENLGLEYVDLYLLHQPIGDIYGAWKALEELYQEGKIKAIWVSNFSAEKIAEFNIFAKIKPMVNQIEVNPFHQNVKNVEYSQNKNLIVESWGSFVEGKNEIFSNPLLTEIWKKYNKSVSQIITRWFIEREIVVLAKTTKSERMYENINIFDFELSSEDMKKIETLEIENFSIFDHKNPEMIEWLGQFV